MSKLTMKQAKELANSDLAKAAGQEFVAEKSQYLGGGPTGSIGTILAETSARGKPLAEMTCTQEGCTKTHTREISDWHQSTKCEDHGGKSKKKSSSAGIGTGRTLKVKDAEGNDMVLKEMKVLDTDDDETKVLKEENNELFEAAWAESQKEKELVKAAAAEERKAKQEEERKVKDAKAAEERKAAVAEARQRAEKYAAERGLKVSPKLYETQAE